MIVAKTVWGLATASKPSSSSQGFVASDVVDAAAGVAAVFSLARLLSEACLYCSLL